MNLAPFCVRRPVFTTMATLIVMILGGISLLRLPVDLMPDITYPTISVSTDYANASPEEIEELVTRRIEDALGSVPGVEEITSVSSEGSSSVRVTFVWGTDLDAAANDIRDRLDRIADNLPDDADRPQLRKFDVAAFPILILGVASDLDPLALRQLIEDQVKYRMERVPGVAAIDIRGGLEREIHVDLDLDRIRAFGLPLNQVLDRIRTANTDRPAGTIREGALDLRVRVPGLYRTVEELGRTIVLERDGVPVRLADVATLRDGWEKPSRVVRINGRDGVRLTVSKQSGTHTVEVAQAVLAEVARINRDVPQVEMVPVIDSSRYIQNSIANVGSAAAYGGLLAVVVLLFFLRNLRGTAVITVTIPVSIVATFAMIYFGGFTLNLMTLGGLALGVGMLVDNSIVVLENISRLRDGGDGAAPAAERGAGEVTSAIVSSTLTTLVVFLPLIFVRGMAGVMFTQFSIVISFALTCSLVAAMTLVPMLSARWLRPIGAGGPFGGRFFRWSGGVFTRLEDSYRRLLSRALDRKAVVIAAALLLLGGSAMLARFIGAEFMPAADEGEVRIEGEMAVGTTLDVMDRQFRRIEEIVGREVPEAENLDLFLGSGGWRSTGGHKGTLRVSLKPRGERKRSSEQIAEALRPKLAGIPGMTVRARVGQGLFLLRMAAGGGEQLNLEIRGHDFAVADVLARRVLGIVEAVDGVTDARVSRDFGAPERRVVIDRDKAADLGLTVEDIARTLEIVLGGVSAGSFREGGDEYRILAQSTRAESMPLDEILDLTLVNRRGELVVLRNVVSVDSDTGPVTIERKNRERIISVDANLSGRDLGSIVDDVRRGLQAVAVPPGFTVAFGGDYEEQQESFRELRLSLVLAVLLVYMVMACQFESLRDPLVVMFSVPFAAVGVILALLATDTTFNVQSFIGCIMLAGIVVNNAILLVDHTNLLRRRDGLPLRAAIEEAGRRRLRPILMTAMTTVLGLLPLALGLNEGGEAQAPMARVVIGGLLSATLITLVVVPVMYALFERSGRPSPDAGAPST